MSPWPASSPPAPGADRPSEPHAPPTSGPQGSAQAPSPSLAPSLAGLFIAFATISLSGFGGVLAWARRTIVEERKWMTAEQFNEAYALCSFLPGGNIINFSVIFGSRLRGPLGGMAALAGLLGPPMVLITIIGALYAHYGDLPALRRMLTGIAAAAAGLMMGTVAKMARPLFRDGAVFGPAIALVTFAAIGILRWPLPLVLAAILPSSIAIAWVRR